MNVAKKLFYMHVKQNTHKKNVSIVSSLQYAADNSGTNIFELAKFLGYPGIINQIKNKGK